MAMPQRFIPNRLQKRPFINTNLTGNNGTHGR
jgi:hypothetical protein